MLLKKCDLLLVEGAGGLMVPITETYMMINLIKELEAKALLVTPSRLGCINDTLLSIMALKTFDINFEWCVNLYEDREDFRSVTQPYYDTGFPDWGEIDYGLEHFVTRLLGSRR
jgi:dethiobiotin synthetase